ncbi:MULTISPECIES: hypothetical protein [unclassified Ruminococcus]|uniref:hypothetical protein n=1 Tax=unclassified Ruminococcus TaxID=2608920 RepID=UPI00210F1DFF|nr:MULTISPECIES: hypothetical protein [unclassified Ruminococcus]MCQ4023344.1 hypothetical protein [Ruminococcus sp. zg-924]MCQ4115376.1 hypothetical protein [Ruminococcus sp. zg-921]
MITVLDVLQNRASGVFALAGALKKGEVNINIKTVGTATVKYISCDRASGRIDWAKIAECAGPTRGYVLCRRGLPVPKKLGFKRFYSQSLFRLMAINGAITVLSLLKTECRKISLCFCDLSGEYSRYAPLFLPLCGTMTILTKSCRYNAFPDYAMGEYGACVSLCTNVRELPSVSVIVAPRFTPLEAYKGRSCTMFSCGESCNPRIKSVSAYSWGLPPKYRALKPNFLSSEYFSQALYSIEKCADAAKISPHSFYVGTQKLSAAAVASNILSPAFCALDTAPPKAYNYSYNCKKLS